MLIKVNMPLKLNYFSLKFEIVGIKYEKSCRDIFLNPYMFIQIPTKKVKKFRFKGIFILRLNIEFSVPRQNIEIKK